MMFALFGAVLFVVSMVLIVALESVDPWGKLFPWAHVLVKWTFISGLIIVVIGWVVALSSLLP
jgi:hypothetical protein